MLKTEHLPECWAKHESDPEAWCICDELRACEQRVSGEYLIGTERQDHLPECDLSKPCDNGKPHHMNNSGWNRCYTCEAGCICDRLRACEERVLDAALKSLYSMENSGGYRVSLYQGDTSGWVFSSLQMAEKWCEQFGNRFIIEEEKQ